MTFENSAKRLAQARQRQRDRSTLIISRWSRLGEVVSKNFPEHQGHSVVGYELVQNVKNLLNAEKFSFRVECSCGTSLEVLSEMFDAE
jgi:hypothetical protein